MTETITVTPGEAAAVTGGLLARTDAVAVSLGTRVAIAVAVSVAVGVSVFVTVSVIVGVPEGIGVEVRSTTFGGGSSTTCVAGAVEPLAHAASANDRRKRMRRIKKRRPGLLCPALYHWRVRRPVNVFARARLAVPQVAVHE